MSWFQNLRISTKLIGSFAVIAIVAGVVGWLGLASTRKLAELADDTYKNDFVAVRELKTAHLQLTMQRLSIREALLTKNFVERQQRAAACVEYAKRLQESIDVYRQTVLGDEEKRVLSEAITAIDGYNSVRERAFGLLLKGEERTTQQILNGEGKAAGETTRKALDRLVEITNRSAEDSRKQSAATAASAQNQMTLVIGVSVLMSLGLGFVIARMIASPLRILSKAANQLAVGDVNVELPAENKDEIGTLAASFKAMADNIRGRSEAAQKMAAGDLSVEVNPKSEQDVLGRSFVQLKAAVGTMASDVNLLVRAAVEGKLSTRADATKHTGDYRRIVEGVNETLDTIVGPLSLAIEDLEKVAAGEIFEEVTADYKGEFAKLKKSLNTLADVVKQRNRDIDVLISSASEGKLDVRADVSKYSGGNAKLISEINTMLDSIVAPLREFGKVLDQLAAGDLTVEVKADFKGEFQKVETSLNTVAIQVRQAMQQIGLNTAALVASSEELNKVSQQMSASADETAAQANVVSAASDQVSKNVQTVATGADEMGASIKEIAKNTADATKVAIAAVKTAETTNQTIEKLGQSSAEIGQVIKVITSIAQQTNLLALNATIEAARAGEAGKGFAVVANEVKELAKETAKATEDISQKIEAIQADTKGAVSAIAQISTVINQINDIQNTIASAVEEQSATTNEISRNLAEAAKGAVDITKNIGGVAEAARSTTAGAVDTQKSAQSLERMASELQELVSQFKYDEQKGSGAKGATASRSKPNGKYVAAVAETYAEAVH